MGQKRLKGIVLRSWDGLPAPIKRIWNERANTVGADEQPTTEAPSRGPSE